MRKNLSGKLNWNFQNACDCHVDETVQLQWSTVFPGKSVRRGNGRILRADFGARHSFDIGSADLHQAIVNVIDGLQALRANRAAHAELVHWGIAAGIQVSDVMMMMLTAHVAVVI